MVQHWSFNSTEKPSLFSDSTSSSGILSILGGRYVHFDAWKVVCGRHVFSSFKPQAARNTKNNKDTEFQNNPSFRGLYEGKIVPFFFSILEQLFLSHRSC